MVTLDDLYEEANRFLWDNYRMALQIPIDIEDDFPKAEGWYEHTKTAPYRICISQDVIIFADDEIVFDVLRHELVHHALHMQRKPFLDGQEPFENELKRLGIASTGSTMVGRYHIYECECCGDEIPHYRRVTDEEKKKLRTVCCTAGFVDKREQAIFDGKRRLY